MGVKTALAGLVFVGVASVASAPSRPVVRPMLREVKTLVVLASGGQGRLCPACTAPQGPVGSAPLFQEGHAGGDSPG